MPSDHERNLALFIDFDNIALGAREARLPIDIRMLIERLLEKGKIIVKKAYADWSHFKEQMTDLHGAGIELIEIPRPRMTGKNSADIRLVVDAMDLCHSKAHVDTFVIVSGDSDFSPLVAKLRENNKSVIGVGVKHTTSNLLVAVCDEFIYYDDLAEESGGRAAESLEELPDDQKKLFDFLLSTTRGLLREGREHLYSSLIKDTMKRKRPAFDENKYGYATFGELLEDAAALELLDVSRDSAAGGTWVVNGFGKKAPSPRGRARRSSRSRGRSGDGGRSGESTISSSGTTRIRRASSGSRASANAASGSDASSDDEQPTPARKKRSGTRAGSKRTTKKRSAGRGTSDG